MIFVNLMVRWFLDRQLGGSWCIVTVVEILWNKVDSIFICLEADSLFHDVSIIFWKIFISDKYINLIPSWFLRRITVQGCIK